MRRVTLETDDGQRIIFGDDVFWTSMEGYSVCLSYEDFAKLLMEHRTKRQGKGKWPGVEDPYREIGMDQPALTKSRRKQEGEQK